MKVILRLLIVVFSIFAAEGLRAQDLRLGGGLVYGSEIDRMGIDLRGDYQLQSNLILVPDFQLFFNRNSGNVRVYWNTINFDFHYLFSVAENFYLYPLAGLNFTFYTVKIRDNRDTSARIGLNLGGGAEYRFSDKIAGFIELKYVVSDADQTVASYGVLVRVN
jgi:outer membrane immunogenic protein